MSRYLIKASYSPEGMKGVMAKGGSARVAAIERLVAGVGGSMESFYFAFGEDDAYIVVDAPSPEAMHISARATARPPSLTSWHDAIRPSPMARCRAR